MGFGGSLAAMITSIKNNERNHKRRNHFDKNEVGGYGEGKKVKFDFPEATPELLRQSREKLQKEHRRMLYKQVVVFAIIVIIIFLIFY